MIQKQLCGIAQAINKSNKKKHSGYFVGGHKERIWNYSVYGDFQTFKQAYVLNWFDVVAESMLYNWFNKNVLQFNVSNLVPEYM